MIAIVVVTHNRVRTLRKCVENVLLRTSNSTSEIVIWDNGSDDGTAEYLEGLTDPRVRVVRHPTNVGMNGYAKAFSLTTAPYMVELDDDVIDAPDGWDEIMLDAFRRLPDVGFLASDLVDDPDDSASYIRHHGRPHEYVETVVDGVRILEGPAGGGLAMTSRAISDEVGGFRERPGEVFWLEDQRYIQDIAEKGYRAAVLADLRVHHRSDLSEVYQSPEKLRYWDRYARRTILKDRVKRLLVALPGVAALNARHGWFDDPRRTGQRKAG